MIAKILNEDNSTQYLKFFYIERLLKFPPNSFVLNKLPKFNVLSKYITIYIILV